MVRDRMEALELAQAFVDPIIDRHGLEKFTTGGNPFSPPQSVMTTVDQHISHILEVAEWLLREGP